MSNPETPNAGLAISQPSQAGQGQENNQQPQQNPQNNVAAPVQVNHSGGDFRCLWTGCGESHASAEVLYVSFQHSRQQWGGC